jgi:hypothetical protein
MLSPEKNIKIENTIIAGEDNIDPEQDRERYPDAVSGAQEPIETKPEFDARNGGSVFGMPELKKTDTTNPLNGITDEKIDELVKGLFKKKENN